MARLRSRRFSSFDPDFTPRWESGCDCKVNLASRNLYSLDAVFTIKDVQSILQRLEFIKERKSWSIAWSWDRSFLLLFFVVSLLSFFFLKSYFFSWWKACFLFSWILLFFPCGKSILLLFLLISFFAKNIWINVTWGFLLTTWSVAKPRGQHTCDPSTCSHRSSWTKRFMFGVILYCT